MIFDLLQHTEAFNEYIPHLFLKTLVFNSFSFLLRDYITTKVSDIKQNQQINNHLTTFLSLQVYLSARSFLS